MASYFNPIAKIQDKLAQRDIDNPAVKCSKQKGVINVSVQGCRAPLPGTNPEAVAGVQVTVTGGPNPAPANTQNDGRKGFGPLPLGSYTVALNFPGNLAQQYDTANVQPSSQQTKTLTGKGVTQYDFLVPWHWIEYDVKDSGNTPVQNIGFKLLQQAGTNWTVIQTGNTPQDGKVKKEKIPAGTYRLSVPTLSNPQWSNPTVNVGIAQTLTVDASDFDLNDNGQFDIVDAFDDSQVIRSIPATVTAGGPGQIMQVNWTPTAGQLKTLKQSRIRFKAVSGTAQCLSDATIVVNPENVRIEDTAGAPIDTPLNVYFSGGSNWNGASAGGQANVPIPWSEKIVRIDFTALTRWRTKLENGLPATSILTKP